MREKTKQITENLLKNSVEMRDNPKLFIKFALLEMGHNIRDVDAASRLFNDIERVNRMWRKVQELNPELRGKQWEKRQKKAVEHKLMELADK